MTEPPRAHIGADIYVGGLALGHTLNPNTSCWSANGPEDSKGDRSGWGREVSAGRSLLGDAIISQCDIISQRVPTEA